ncbi:MAG TPA: glycosyltransferase [Thermoanaerobaculia bacterium]|nr:glycosyltransferase [Thermoanaerobaculia bacterium]
MPLTPIQGLWVEGPLTAMEQLSLRSFLAQGHPYHLYSYDAVPNLPAGAELRPAAEVLPASAVFRYSAEAGGSYAAFSNLFRYRLLHQRGGWWADTDVVCLRPFDFAAERVFASERRREGGKLCTSCVLKVPAGDAACGDCCEQARCDQTRATVWGATGPRLLGRVVREQALEGSVQSPEVFCPIDWWRAADLHGEAELPAAAYAVHLWHEMWRHHGWRKDPCYPSRALYQRLHARYPAREPAAAAVAASLPPRRSRRPLRLHQAPPGSSAGSTGRRRPR